ncbi:MAG: isoleucine--tRNA ligase [Bacteroidia bacterium]|nr:isoleucine--tRNA ligase [Bacteroidia bacterium]
MTNYKTYNQLNLPEVAIEAQKKWEAENTFDQSIETREGKAPFVFYEGPPSANGLPGIHHVMARTIKDIFCRYKTLKGYQVKRKAGWDTHGLPVELGVEKSLGITKEDIGTKITVEQYNLECRKDVMKYTDVWITLTQKMGYWVDMQNPYITYNNKYIESVWWLLAQLYKKNVLYKGYTIQPYSPAAGTGLSSHELNQPGCYRDVKDRTAVAMFKMVNNTLSESLFTKTNCTDIYFLAWTTTPWTLPSNTALAVGKKINYVLVKTYHPYLFKVVNVVLAKDLLDKYFPAKNKDLSFETYKEGDKNIPFEVIAEIKGEQLLGISYHQLLPFAQPENGDSFKVIPGDFVTTVDGTGIVHMAPSFGADDFRAAQQSGIGSLTLVDKRGKFLPQVSDGIFLYGNEYVKEAYLSAEELEQEFQHQKKVLESNGKIKELKNYLSVDERIILKLQEEGKLFKKESYEHSYPHCWRTDKPVLYYPLDSWFIKTTDFKERMIELNNTINWKPESTGSGRFGNWLENLNDWNLSRSRFWGIPIPIWTSEDKTEQICIESAEHLKAEIENAISKGFMTSNPLAAFVPGNNDEDNYNTFDLHKPYADNIVLERNGKKLVRETDLIDVWFDSGAMPYAQVHYPFENKELIDKNLYYPADFIAEGVDQTRGWFFTLHAIAAMCFDSVAYKNVVSNGLVLDKNGQKMSKRLGNAVDPFQTIDKYGPDATRWYMITNAAPWDNLKFDVEGISEVQRKFFGTLHNTYSFFALYANVDGFSYKEENIPLHQRPEIDRWIISELNTLIKNVEQAYDEYEPHRAGRLIEEFVDEHLSNWYVRLCRRRFWKGDYSNDKVAAYQTLYTCLETLSILFSPIAPFFAERLFGDLNAVTQKIKSPSVHLSNFPKYNPQEVDSTLEQKMELAQKISSMILAIRKRENIRVRQPLAKIQIPVLNDDIKSKIEAVKDLILSEVNVKEMDLVNEDQTHIVKNLKLNFKTLGKKYGKFMKNIQDYTAKNEQQMIKELELNNSYVFSLDNNNIEIESEDVQIIPVDIPGWKTLNNGALTVALDIVITEKLREEGIARELVNRIQNLRKELRFDLTDRIILKIKSQNEIKSAVLNNLDYICTEILANKIDFIEQAPSSEAVSVELEEGLGTVVQVVKV